MPIKSEIRKREAAMSNSQDQSQPSQSTHHLPHDPTRHLTSHPGPANPSSPEENQQADQQAAQARKAADQQTLQKLQGIYVYTHKTDPGSLYPYEGVCLRCGWHTLELSEDAAKQLVNAHIAIHWRDAVIGITMQGGQGLLGVGPATANLREEAMKAQEQGAVKGGQEALKPIQQKEQQLEQQFEQLAQQLAQPSSSSSASSSSGSGQQGQQYGG